MTIVTPVTAACWILSEVTWGAVMHKSIPAICTAFILFGCALVDREKLAQEAQTSMIGMTKEQALTCMGPPNNKDAEGATEVWSYPSGGPAYVSNKGVVATETRLCTTNLTMTAGRVSQVTYLSPYGAPLPSNADECAYALRICMKH